MLVATPGEPPAVRTLDSTPIVNTAGGHVALGPLSRALVPLYTRWPNDFELIRTFGDPPRLVMVDERQAWHNGEVTTTEASRPRSA